MTQENYVLAVGDADLKRMDLLGSFYLPYNKKFLLDNGLKNGMKVADIGCGPGGVALWLAQTVGLQGHVTAIDNSIEQLTILKKRIAENHLHNITTKQANIYELSEFKEQFDLIFCRFLFIHLVEPLKALQELQRALKPGGKLILGDVDNASWYSYPENESLQQDIKLLCKMGKARGTDLRIGPKLPHLFQQAGFRNITVEIAQPVLQTPVDREYLMMKVQAWKQAYLDCNLISQSDFDALLVGIKELVADKDYLLAGAQMFQVCGTK